jgi:hypothetical protein
MVAALIRIAAVNLPVFTFTYRNLLGPRGEGAQLTGGGFRQWQLIRGEHGWRVDMRLRTTLFIGALVFAVSPTNC